MLNPHCLLCLVYMGSLFKYLNSQRLFESYLTFTRLDFTCIRCIAVSEGIIPNEVSLGGSPTINFALPPIFNSYSYSGVAYPACQSAWGNEKLGSV